MVAEEVVKRNLQFLSSNSVLELVELSVLMTLYNLVWLILSNILGVSLALVH